MTHFWMKITNANDASQSNLELVAKLLCEIARYELLYPHAFGQGRLEQLRVARALGTSSSCSAAVAGGGWPVAAGVLLSLSFQS